MKRPECRQPLGGLDAIVVGDLPASAVVIVLHGRLMYATDLAPFAHSLDLDATFVIPDAPLVADTRGRCWWPSDAEERARRGGPIDLFALDPPGRAAARAALEALCRDVAHDVPLALVGFSQGGMLAMDFVLHGGRADLLALLSSSRIAYADWLPRLGALSGKPVLVAHGHEDAELPFAAGLALRDATMAGGARTEWLAFEGGHVIPLVVWRALRRFLRAHGFDARHASSP
jgi:phospholipase/carboxylesterase